MIASEGRRKPAPPVGYTARDAARLVGLPVPRLRACVRAGLVAPRRGPRREYRFSFQDLILLRSAKALLERFPARRVQRALRRLGVQLPRGRGLAGVRLTAIGGAIVVRDGTSAWVAESGQGLLDFDVAALARGTAPVARLGARAACTLAPEYDADDWFDLASELEAVNASEARLVYERVLELDPGHADAHLNLGRLVHETGAAEAALEHYGAALRARPDDATAAFNMGVALEDLHRPAQAVGAYLRALAADPGCADAHYNLARLHERLGRRGEAFRHLQAYRALTLDDAPNHAGA